MTPAEKKLDVRTTEIWKPFLINLCLVILLFGLGIYIGLVIRQRQAVELAILTRARAHFAGLLGTHRWNTHYGGVYVEKKPGVTANPFLENPDITTVDGRVFTMKNSALMTREISELAKKGGAFTFHITSLTPLNPANRPDDFERQALKSFERGARERYAKVKAGTNTSFRYMAPLFVEQGCLKCHAKQGYQEGDVRGGISVTFDISRSEQALRQQMVILVVVSIVSLLILMAIISHLVRKLIARLNSAITTIQTLTTTDELTRLPNRRHFFARFNGEASLSVRHQRTLSLIMFDLDHFRRVNDEYGHQIGDLALKEISVLVKEVCRSTDILARYGGEEFIAALPETDAAGALALAEKLRQRIADQAIPLDMDDVSFLHLTASFGLVTRTAEQLKAMASYEKMIQLADLALHQAKARGRNRVEVFESAARQRTDGE